VRAVPFGLPTEKSGIPLRMGVAKGFYRDEGIALEIRTLYGGPLLAKAYDSGEIPMGQMGAPPAANALSRGAGFRIVGGGLRRKAHMYLAARAGTQGVTALKNGQIGVLSLGSCDEWFCRVICQHEGLDPDRDIEMVCLGAADYPHVIDMIAAGRLAGAILIEPNVAAGEAAGTLTMLRAVYEQPYLPPVQWIVRVANGDFMRREPDVVRAVLRAARRSAHYAAQHTDAWRDFMVEQYAVPAEAASHAIARELPHMHLDGEIDMAGLDNMFAIQHRLGALDGPLRAADVVDFRFLEPLAAA
jgi:NitT/TauT family transport system substrate-binding protein